VLDQARCVDVDFDPPNPPHSPSPLPPTTDNGGNEMRFYVFFGPIWSTFFLSAFFYISTIRVLNKCVDYLGEPPSHHRHRHRHRHYRRHPTHTLYSRHSRRRYTEVASEVETQMKLRKLAANLKWYPLLFIFSWAFITVVRVMDWVGNKKPAWITIVQVRPSVEPHATNHPDTN